MKVKDVLLVLVLLVTWNVRLLSGGEIKLVRAFETWKGNVIKSTDPAGIVYHPPSGHLFIADSEINEIAAIWDCENIFEVNLAGNEVSHSFDSYVNEGLPCPETVGREPTGITYNEFDNFFYVTNDDKKRILRYSYEAGFGEAIAARHVPGEDLEGITSDPSTGYLYVVVGEGESKVLVYNSDLEYISQFLVNDRVLDPEGIAYNQQRNHLFLVSHKDQKIFEYTLDGKFINDYDISGFSPTPIDPQGLTFAPSSDLYDDPNHLNLYIVDGQLDNSPDPDLDRDGIVYEADISSTEFIPQEELPVDFLVDRKFKLDDKYSESQGIVHSNGKIEIKPGLPSSHTGNLTAVSHITIEDKNTINGDITAGGKLKIKSGTTVNGTTGERAGIARIRLPIVFFTAGGPDVQLAEDEFLSLEPGSYGKVEADKRSRLMLKSGEYFFEKMVLKENASLSVELTSVAGRYEEVAINVISEVKFGKRTQVDIVPTGESGSRYLTLKQVKNKEIAFEEGARFWGSIIAPKAKKVKFDKNVEFKGRIVAQEIEVKENATLISHSSSLSLARKHRYQTDVTSVEAESDFVPSGFGLSQNYPNPFNPETTIRFKLPDPGHVILRILNIRGQEIRRLIDGPYQAGSYDARWDSNDNYGNSVSSGIYFYQLQANGFYQIKMMNLIK